MAFVRRQSLDLIGLNKLFTKHNSKSCLEELINEPFAVSQYKVLILDYCWKDADKLASIMKRQHKIQKQLAPIISTENDL